MFSINLSIGGWLELNFGLDSILAILRKCYQIKILAGGDFPKGSCMDRVRLWVLGDHWCDGVAEHKAIYFYILKKIHLKKFGGN